MTSQADLDRYVASQRGVRRLALRDLAAWWSTIEHLSPAEQKAAAEEFLPLLARTYGEVSATAAADFYEQSRASSGVAGLFAAQIAPSSAAAQARAATGWAVQPLFSGDPAAALTRMAKVADAAALQHGRDTLIANGERDPKRPRWARVPSGKTCAWCLMLASRGPVYRSAASAGGAVKFHDDCDCQPVMSWDGGRDLPEGYDEGELYGLYERARADANSGDPKKITAALRRLDGGAHVNDGVTPRL